MIILCILDYSYSTKPSRHGRTIKGSNKVISSDQKIHDVEFAAFSMSELVVCVSYHPNMTGSFVGLMFSHTRESTGQYIRPESKSMVTIKREIISLPICQSVLRRMLRTFLVLQ